MKEIKNIVQNHIEDCIPHLRKWGMQHNVDEFRRGIIQIKTTEEENELLKTKYESKMENGSFIIRGADIGTAIKNIFTVNIIAEFPLSTSYELKLLEDTNIKVKLVKDKNEKINLYILISGKFFMLVAHILKEMDIKASENYSFPFQNSVCEWQYINAQRVKHVSAKAIYIKAFKKDIVTINGMPHNILVSRQINLNDYIRSKGIIIEPNTDYIGYFTYDAFDLYDNDIDTIKFKFIIRKRENMGAI